MNWSNTQITLYIGDEIQDEFEFEFDPGTGTRELDDSRWRIGIGFPDVPEYSWPSHADIDDARIYSRVLSQDEIRSLAQAG